MRRHLVVSLLPHHCLALLMDAAHVVWEVLLLVPRLSLLDRDQELVEIHLLGVFDFLLKLFWQCLNAELLRRLVGCVAHLVDDAVHSIAMVLPDEVCSDWQIAEVEVVVFVIPLGEVTCRPHSGTVKVGLLNRRVKV